MNENPINARYTEGVAEIDGFSEKYYVSEGTDGGSKFDHTSSRIEGAAEKLAGDYAGVPVIEEVARRLGEPTLGNRASEAPLLSRPLVRGRGRG